MYYDSVLSMSVIRIYSPIYPPTIFIRPNSYNPRRFICIILKYLFIYNINTNI